MSSNVKFLFKVLSVTVGSLIILLYIFYQGKNIIEGPIISIQSPINGATLTSSLIEVRGISDNIAQISLNDRPIFIDEKGFFRERILLSPGYNIIKLRGEDKFGRSKEQFLELIYRDYDKKNSETTKDS
ncbi:MAG: hypothetical protein AAB706_00415 [Patescibacteria group bacterium]